MYYEEDQPTSKYKVNPIQMNNEKYASKTLGVIEPSRQEGLMVNLAMAHKALADLHDVISALEDNLTPVTVVSLVDHTANYGIREEVKGGMSAASASAGEIAEKIGSAINRIDNLRNNLQL